MEIDAGRGSEWSLHLRPPLDSGGRRASNRPRSRTVPGPIFEMRPFAMPSPFRQRRASRPPLPLLAYLGTACLLLMTAACGVAEEQSDDTLVIGFVGVADSAQADGWRGARLGGAEVQHAAELIGRALALRGESAGDSAAAYAAGVRLVEQGARVLVGGYDPPSCRALMRLADSADVVFLNAGCSSDDLRGASRNTFHVQASDAQRRSADGGPAAVRPEARLSWHGELGRYGAAQLNRRFLEQFGAPPGQNAWATWMAMKIAWEALQQVPGADASQLRAYLESDAAEFDGHKGQPLVFERGTHQLRQPLFAAPVTDAGGAAAPDARTIAVDGGAALRAAMAEGAHLALVTNEGSSDVSVIDGRTHAVITTIRLVARPRGVQVSPDGTRAYIAMSDDAPSNESDADAIAVIDLARAEVIALHRAGSDPEQFALSPDGRRLYAANEDAGTATVSVLATDSVRATLVVGIEPEGVAASPDGRWVYVTAETSNTVSVIDAARNEVVASFLVDVRPRAAAFAPDSRRAFVSNEISGSLTVVEVPSHRVIATIPLAGGKARPVGIAVAPDGSRVYVANGHANSISVIDPQALREIAVIPVGRRPWGVALTRDGSVLYTANGVSNDVSIIDTRTLQVVARVPVGERPWGVALAR